MADIAKRFASNPILRPQDVKPSLEGLQVECLLNPGAFRYQGKTALLLRVAERPQQKEGIVSTPILDPEAAGGIRILEFRRDDPDLIDEGDPRAFKYKGQTYLTTLSHLRLAWSEDGVNFRVDESPTMLGQGPLESFGIEDCRVTEIEGTFYLTYTAVSPYGIGVSMSSTTDWQHFTHHGMIIPPTNKDNALFPEKIGDYYYILHRPSGFGIGGSYIWLSRSPDLLHWGEHTCLAVTRPGMWDSARVGAGASPVRTAAGWLEIYHGADEQHRYCLGALLLDADNPAKVLARSREPIMEPIMDYEKAGFFGNVVFTNGMVVDGDQITLYYGASDEVVCGATISMQEMIHFQSQMGG
ncbi:MAG TPA: glycoside hydrolase family 130 protein [Ktedonobacteraceae bacterium]|nr:glycoside hydrolase family 130 protein [Ktedonobacteraceae bacterium]